MTFDEIRANNPDLLVNVYAMEPHGLVTLEIIDADRQSFVFRAETLEAALAAAFPEHTAPNVFE